MQERHPIMPAIIPNDWFRHKGTPEDFEQEELQRKAMAFNVPMN
jgi:hypothetical protein